MKVKEQVDTYMDKPLADIRKTVTLPEICLPSGKKCVLLFLGKEKSDKTKK